jgi:DNA-binding NarL/FixJ family response regulator
MVELGAAVQGREMQERAGTLDVLIVDDSAKFSEALESFIAEIENVRTFRAATAAEGLARARALRPAVVLMDVVLPDGNGIEVTRQILAELRGSTEVIMMTFHDDVAYERRALEAGARAFMVKQRLMNDLPAVLVDIRARRSKAAAER